jgi:4-hydroxy-tetrahydrodipicolinate reductase
MKVALIGYGKMGRAIEKLLDERGHEVVVRFDREGIDPELLQKAEVAIEFTRPEAAVTNLSQCFEAGVPVVSGTTGWLAQYDEVCELCETRKGALLYASNFSLGVNVLFALNEKLGKIMNAYPDYEVSIREIHHTQKLDAPSGTAISLAEQVIENLERKEGWSMDDRTDSRQIMIEALREDNIPGTHIVKYDSEIDAIELTHTAHNRKGFALGAVLAAEFLCGRQGIYSMKDVLKI